MSTIPLYYTQRSYSYIFSRVSWTENELRENEVLLKNFHARNEELERNPENKSRNFATILVKFKDQNGEENEELFSDYSLGDHKDGTNHAEQGAWRKAKSALDLRIRSGEITITSIAIASDLAPCRRHTEKPDFINRCTDYFGPNGDARQGDETTELVFKAGRDIFCCSNKEGIMDERGNETQAIEAVIRDVELAKKAQAKFQGNYIPVMEKQMPQGERKRAARESKRGPSEKQLSSPVAPQSNPDPVEFQPTPNEISSDIINEIKEILNLKAGIKLRLGNTDPQLSKNIKKICNLIKEGKKIEEIMESIGVNKDWKDRLEDFVKQIRDIVLRVEPSIDLMQTPTTSQLKLPTPSLSSRSLSSQLQQEPLEMSSEPWAINEERIEEARSLAKKVKLLAPRPVYLPSLKAGPKKPRNMLVLKKNDNSPISKGGKSSYTP